jgi:hypothetical protein
VLYMHVAPACASSHLPVMPNLYSFTSIPALKALENAFLTSMSANKHVGMPHIPRVLIASTSAYTAYTATNVLRANWKPTCVNVMSGRLNLRPFGLVRW